MKNLIFLLILLCSASFTTVDSFFLNIKGDALITAGKRTACTVTVVERKTSTSKQWEEVNGSFDFKLPLGYKYLLLFHSDSSEAKLVDVNTIDAPEVHNYSYEFDVLLPKVKEFTVKSVANIYYDKAKFKFTHQQY